MCWTMRPIWSQCPASMIRGASARPACREAGGEDVAVAVGADLVGERRRPSRGRPPGSAARTRTGWAFRAARWRNSCDVCSMSTSRMIEPQTTQMTQRSEQSSSQFWSLTLACHLCHLWLSACQCRKCRTPVNSIAMPCSSQAAMLSASSLRAAGLDDRGDARPRPPRPRCPRNGKNASDASTLPFDSLAGLLDRDLDRLDAAHLPGPDADDLRALRQHDRVALDVLAHEPREVQGVRTRPRSACAS